MICFDVVDIEDDLDDRRVFASPKLWSESMLKEEEEWRWEGWLMYLCRNGSTSLAPSGDSKNATEGAAVNNNQGREDQAALGMQVECSRLYYTMKRID